MSPEETRTVLLGGIFTSVGSKGSFTTNGVSIVFANMLVHFFACVHTSRFCIF